LSAAAFTAEQRVRASELVRFIFSLPGFTAEPPLLTEHSIAEFFRGLGAKYAGLFSYNGWFEGLDPKSTDRLLLSMLRSVVDENVLAVFRGFIESADFSLFDEFSVGPATDMFRREKLYSLVETMLADDAARRGLNSAYCVIRYNTAERYLGEMHRIHPGLYSSVATVDFREMDPDKAAVFFKTAMILLNSRHMAGGPVTLPSFPDTAALCPRGDSGELPRGADFIDILELRFRNAGYYEQPGRVCVSADVSWFDMARRPGILLRERRLAEIFYKTALERNW
jgi:hypothetical protein